jgi:hypothetical protein
LICNLNLPLNMVSVVDDDTMECPTSEDVVPTIPSSLPTIDMNTTNTTPIALSTNKHLDNTMNNTSQTSVEHTSDKHLPNILTSSQNSTQNTDKTVDGIVELYHNNDKYYVFEEYTDSDTNSYKNPEHVCFYTKTRNCIVVKSKIISQGKQQPRISNTVFASIPCVPNCKSYSLVDIRLIKCLNPTCKSSVNKLPKTFHFCCYMNMMATNTEEIPAHLTSADNKDRILDFVKSSADLSNLFEKISISSSTLIYPMCGKRCYNKLGNHRNKVKKKENSDYATAASWDNDGDGSKLSSIQVLINWLTTEENCSSYFGGIDVNGRTSAHRKETYHHQIREMIKKENGTDRSSDSIKNKIARVMASYKQANEHLSQTGAGMDDAALSTYQEWITKNVCKYYFELDTVLKDRPNVRPWYTNEKVMKLPDECVAVIEKDSNKTTAAMNSSIVELLDSDDSSDDEKHDNSAIEYESNKNDNFITSESNFNAIPFSSSFECNKSTVLETPDATSSDEYQSSSTPSSPKKRKERQAPPIRKLSPIEAKGIQRNMVKKKKSIAKRNGTNDLKKMLGIDDDDKDFIKETTITKINQENQRFLRMEKIEDRKFKMDNERLKLEKTALRIKSETATIQNNIEKGKYVLMRLEIFKTRETIKKELPHVTEEYLDRKFPYPPE